MNERISEIAKVDYDSVLNLGEYAFNYKLSEHDRSDRKKEMDTRQKVLGSYKNNQLVAKLHILPMQLFLGDKEFKFGGIAGVATWPEFRRRGNVQQLLRFALEEMKGQSLSLSMLHPFSIGFYRKYGWELTQYVYKYNFSPTDLRKAKVTGNCYRIEYETYKDVLQCLYESNAKQYGLMMKRDDWWWENRVISKDDSVVIYFDESGKPQGYLIANMKDRVLKIKEIVYCSGKACYGLLEWIRNHDSMTDEVEMIVQPHDQIAYYFENPKVKMSKSAYFMTRIVDFESFIKDYPFFETMEEKIITINLKDDIAEWNNGRWTLIFKNNRVVKVLRNEKISSSITLSTNIQTLSAALFGSEPIERLISFNRLSVEGNVEELKQIIQPLQPNLLDFF